MRSLRKGIYRAARLPGSGLLFMASLVFVSLLLSVRSAESGQDSNNIEKHAVKRVQPEYPVLARKNQIEGIVVVKLDVSNAGTVTNTEFIRGHNVFRSVSLEAAKNWVFKKGEERQGTIRFIFKLDQ